MRGVILVEGASDKGAVEALAVRRGRDLGIQGVLVVAIGGAHAIGAALERFGPRGLDVRLGGLYDEREEHVVRRGVERAGLGVDLSHADLKALGFFGCENDLEYELVRAVGTEAVLGIVEREGELVRFRTFQKQLAKRELSLDEQAWRFMWNRKVRYAPLLVEALDLTRVPRPLDAVLAHVCAGG